MSIVPVTLVFSNKSLITGILINTEIIPPLPVVHTAVTQITPADAGHCHHQVQDTASTWQLSREYTCRYEEHTNRSTIQGDIFLTQRRKYQSLRINETIKTTTSTLINKFFQLHIFNKYLVTSKRTPSYPWNKQNSPHGQRSRLYIFRLYILMVMTLRYKGKLHLK